MALLAVFFSGDSENAIVVEIRAVRDFNLVEAASTMIGIEIHSKRNVFFQFSLLVSNSIHIRFNTYIINERITLLLYTRGYIILVHM